MPNPTISSIQLPSGNVYDIKDSTARDAIAALQSGSYFLGVTTTALSNNSTTNPITIDGESVTATNGNIAVYGNAEFIFNGTKWIEFGDLSSLGALAYKDNVTLNKGNGDNVLGESTTFTAASSSVTISGGSTDSVLGAGTTFTASNPTVTVTPSTTNIKATASGTAVGADGTAAAVTDYPNPTLLEDTAYQFSPTIRHLETASITPVGGTEGVSLVTKTEKKLTTTTVPNVTGNTAVSIPNVTGNTDVSIPNVTSVGTASDWSFTMGSGTAAETLIIGGGNSTTPTLGTALSASKVTLGTALSASKVTLGTAKTVATGGLSETSATSNVGSTITESVTITPKTVATAGTSTTVATGSSSANGSGSGIVTNISYKLGDAISKLGTPDTANCLTGVKVTTQPTVSLSTGATAGAGVISVATGISSATASGTAVSANSDDLVDAVTNVGTATAAAQTITVGTNDKVKVAKYSDLSVTVS